jgi:hypothetical protein
MSEKTDTGSSPNLSLDNNLRVAWTASDEKYRVRKLSAKPPEGVDRCLYTLLRI